MEDINYKLQSEYKVDFASHEVKKQIATAEDISVVLIEKWKRRLDLENPDEIEGIYVEAKKEGLFDRAKETRELIFGKDIHFYGVCYMWDMCVNSCIYCPASVENREESGFENRELTVEQTIEDTKSVMEDGHTHICYLTGEDPGGHPAETLVEYLIAIDSLGLDEIILNIGPQTTRDFAVLREVVKRTSLQFRVFQETYNRRTYARNHPWGPKKDYDFRVQSQERALEAGFDNVGLGVLFGLHRFPIKEIEAIKKHAIRLKVRCGKLPARICLPSVSLSKNLKNKVPYDLPRGEYDSDGNLIKKNAYEMLNELIYALSRIAMPLVSIVSSERNQKGMLEILDHYATCTTLNVHPGVGDNMKYHSGEIDETLHFEQATSYPRNPEETIKNMRLKGFNPIINL